MTNEEIVKSQAFKILNHMIDMKAAEVQRQLDYIKREIEYIYGPKVEYKTFITTRVHEEGSARIDLPVNLTQLKRVGEIIQEIIQSENQLNQLTRQKLRLLNDYDFTRGDDSEQKKIFG